MEKWDLLKLFQEWGGGRIMDGANSIMIYVRNFVNGKMYLQYNNNKKEKKKDLHKQR
jgi:hypothetical protein